jgi:adenylate cyclase class IV
MINTNERQKCNVCKMSLTMDKFKQKRDDTYQKGCEQCLAKRRILARIRKRKGAETITIITTTIKTEEKTEDDIKMPINYTTEEKKMIMDYATIMNCKASEISRKVIELVARYGETGYGDKPQDMNRVQYWLGHID